MNNGLVMRYFILFFALLGIAGCNHRSVSNENITEDKPKTAVTLTHITFGKIFYLQQRFIRINR